ncbi:MAG TPA: glycerophosphodiester phosphodiesterase [Candidatus Saccharimonadales bacterium]|nr:glycerophosphodiester phosphodiesterase [Candidatus Saccharimonadales bacterium]
MTKVIGHRGARGLAPENTIEAIEAAIRAGADAVEIDVRVSADGVPVLNHNPFLQDDKGNDLPHVQIHKLSYAELLTRKASLPTLEEAIRRVSRRVPMIIEVKPKVHIRQTVHLVRSFLQQGWQANDFLLASFSQRTLQSLHRELPGIDVIVNEHWSGAIASWRAKRLRTKHISIGRRVLWWGFVAGMHRRGYNLYTYTLNDPKKARRWAARGLYGIVTDFPDIMKQKLNEK